MTDFYVKCNVILWQELFMAQNFAVSWLRSEIREINMQPKILFLGQPRN